jgi:hypothetical protein
MSPRSNKALAEKKSMDKAGGQNVAKMLWTISGG